MNAPAAVRAVQPPAEHYECCELPVLLSSSRAAAGPFAFGRRVCCARLELMRAHTPSPSIVAVPQPSHVRWYGQALSAIF